MADRNFSTTQYMYKCFTGVTKQEQKTKFAEYSTEYSACVPNPYIYMCIIYDYENFCANKEE